MAKFHFNANNYKKHTDTVSFCLVTTNTEGDSKCRE